MISPRTAEASTEWAVRQFSEVRLGDVRRTRRAVKVAAAMAAHPAASIPDQNNSWSDTKAVYRLFAEQDVTFEALVSPHWRQTRQEASTLPVVLLVQDGSQLDYTRHKTVDGLGFIGDGNGKGLMLHSVLAVDPSGGAGGVAKVLGLAHQRLWTRREVPLGETRTQRRDRQQQARVWTEAVNAVGSCGVGSRWIHVADREADNFDFLEACRRKKMGFVVRAYQDRRGALGHEASCASGHLLELARSLPSLGSTRLYLRRRPTRAPGWYTLQVSGGPMTIFTPWLNRTDAPPLRCWVVRVWEASPGPEQIEWILLCSEAVESLEAALTVAHWYSCRWLIEEYHKCLKTGCRVEQRQLEDMNGLKAVIGMLAVVAVRLLQLKQHARLNPARPASQCVGAEHLQVLAAYWKKPSDGMTAQEFWRYVARMGGFLARRGDGEPGWQTIWRGWQKLDLMTLGVSVIREGQKCG
jgi:hypothetical protein